MDTDLPIASADMNGVRVLTAEDIDWVVDVLARRRRTLAPHAPVYWRPAPDARERHREWLGHLITEGGAVGVRTECGVMVAAPGRHGWTIDDAWVAPDSWDGEGLTLWNHTMDAIGPQPWRFVCPAFEPARVAFATDCGMSLSTSWWHTDIPRRAARADAGEEPRLDGARVGLVPAPPVYDPGGPITHVWDVHDLTALDRARDEASRCGSPLVVVDQPAHRTGLARALRERGYVRHCYFFDGHG